MLHLGQMSSPRLLEPKRKRLASKMSPSWDFALWLNLVSKLLANGCPSQMLHLGQLPSPRLLEPERKSLTFEMRFCSMTKFGVQAAHGCPSKMLHLAQMSSPRLLVPKRKSLVSKINPPCSPLLYLVSKILANGYPSQMLNMGQMSLHEILLHDSMWCPNF